MVRLASSTVALAMLAAVTAAAPATPATDAPVITTAPAAAAASANATLAPKAPKADKPTVKFAAPLPKEIKLNDRKGKVVLEYAGLGAADKADTHVDIMGNTWPYWFGGGMASVDGPEGTTKVPMEVRVPSYYTGPLYLRAYLAAPGTSFDDRLADAPDVPVNLSKVPVDSIGVLCSPIQVTPGKDFTLNLWYTQTHPRQSDVIAVALNDVTKEYWGGFTVPINQMMGHVSGVFHLKPGAADLPLKFKAWISPRGEEAPNYVSYTMINAKTGPNVIQDCTPTVKNEWTPSDLPPADWVELSKPPKKFKAGDAVKVGTELQLASEREATLVVSLMDWNWDTHASNMIASASTTVRGRDNDAAVTIDVPADAKPAKDGVYWVAYLTPVNGTYDDSLAEDRVYKTTLTPLDPATATKEAEVSATGGLRGGKAAPAAAAN